MIRTLKTQNGTWKQGVDESWITYTLIIHIDEIFDRRGRGRLKKENAVLALRRAFSFLMINI